MIEIGDNVLYGRDTFKVLGFAASEDSSGKKLVELTWNNYNVSPTGYLAVPESKGCYIEVQFF